MPDGSTLAFETGWSGVNRVRLHYRLCCEIGAPVTRWQGIGAAPMAVGNLYTQATGSIPQVSKSLR